MPELQIGGVTPLTTLDYPGELAAVVFCQGCPWRCRYCQNGHLLGKDPDGGIPWPEVVGLLRRRRGLLDAVVFSGGEPTAQAALPEAIDQVHGLGFKVGLHTAGCYPERLRRLLPSIDWLGLDIKGFAEDYPNLTGVPDSGSAAWRSLDHVLAVGTACEVRITAHAALLPPERLRSLVSVLRDRGATNIAVQNCKWQRALDSRLGPSIEFARLTEGLAAASGDGRELILRG
jgi:pyruvate formate lyase activating enzyme